tara:strand:- start:12 stop:362 length:351 start_codon:yes stop_codon:yes gene_type:complete
MDIETISNGSNFLANMGANLGTVVILGVGYFIYIKCGGSHCKYTSQDGFEIEFNGDEKEEDDDEDKHIKDIMKLLIQRKSIKVLQKKNSNENLVKLNTNRSIPKIIIPINTTPENI